MTLLRNGTIQSVSEWEKLCYAKPKKPLKWIRAWVSKEPSKTPGTPA